MKRYEIFNENELCKTVNFIHFNAGYHEHSKKPLEWKWSSYKAFVIKKRTAIQVEEMLKVFGGIESFELAHREMVKAELQFEFIS
jgi:hypothetical protein